VRKVARKSTERRLIVVVRGTVVARFVARKHWSSAVGLEAWSSVSQRAEDKLRCVCDETARIMCCAPPPPNADAPGVRGGRKTGASALGGGGCEQVEQQLANAYDCARPSAEAPGEAHMDVDDATKGLASVQVSSPRPETGG